MVNHRDFHLTVLGRTLEHLGVQMYKRRDVAIAELVANCWDAGANNVWITAPERGNYSAEKSRIIITDDGEGMNADQVENEYLVVGRNRREDSRTVVGQQSAPSVNTEAGSANRKSSVVMQPPALGKMLLREAVSETRPVMGRKGIGKLAGFGLAKLMSVDSWKDGASVNIRMNIDELKLKSGVAKDIVIPGVITPVLPSAKSATGTKIILQDLKHSTVLDLEKLREALARRFSRRVRGRMNIFVNDESVGDPTIVTEYRMPASDEGLVTEKLSDGQEVHYRYAFSKNPIPSPELRGFTIYVRGKTAQAPPFYFQVESTASGQHATKYLTGEIEADFLDSGTDDESDLVSTDRQEIDWDNDRVGPLLEWGKQVTRKLFREWSDRNGDRMEEWILQDEELNSRIEKLDAATRKQVKSFLRKLGNLETVKEPALELASSMVRAYEYRHFIDVIDEIEAVADDPEALQTLLTHLADWNVLESRAILEIIKGRLSIVEKFGSLIVNDAPETKSSRSMDNLHDLLAGQPWLLNPEWQVLYEERSVTKQLREWGYQDESDERKRERFDFLALTGNGQLVVIEIKRPGHPVSFEELSRLEGYRNRLSKAHSDDLYMVMIYGGGLDGSVSSKTKENWDERVDGELREWSSVFSTTREYYEHYRAVLEGNIEHPDFHKKSSEVTQTRAVLARGSVHRDVEARQKGLGPQDSNYVTPQLPA
ncbi:MAG TPA: ATP-binding protein [Pyrinomonadaceae bacterium]|nr:ATP-binding protein [Pyrinomonadaceae bacterium]